MADEILKRDANNEPVIGMVTDDSNQFIKMGRIDDTTKGLKVMVVGGAGTGTVTSLTASTGITLTPNPITTTGTIGLTDTAVTPGTYTLATITIDQQGRITSALRGSGVGLGTVTSVSVTTAAGVSGSVATATTTPAITITLGALTGVTSLNGLVVTANTGVITTGTWNGAAIIGTYGGTGVNNSTRTFTYLKNISFTAADDTGVYTLPTGTKTLLATDGAGTSLTGIPYTLTGTANQVVLSAGTGNITFTLPQSIATSSTPTFSTLLLTGASSLVLGVNTTTLGSVKMFGSTSGDVTVKPAAVAGTATVFQLPATNGSNTNVLQTDGAGVTSWVAAGAGAGAAVLDVQIFTVNGTWTKPSGSPLWVEVICIGAGGGGGSGGKTAAAAFARGGGGGGGGAVTRITLRASDVGATETVTVGVGGTGGASVIANDTTNGNAGTAGGLSSFGTWLLAGGGGSDTSGGNTSGAGGGSGGSAVGYTPGKPNWTGAGLTGAGAIGGMGGESRGSVNADIGMSEWGGAGGGIQGNNNDGLSAGSSVFATGGGGGGGGSDGTTARAGGAGGAVQSQAWGGGGAGGAAGGANAGAAGSANTVSKKGFGGFGGGGGGGSHTTDGGAGGGGGLPGGGGGGGGVARNANGNSGVGGAGGAGLVKVITYF